MNKLPLKILFAGSAEGIRQTELVIRENFDLSESRCVDTPAGLLDAIDVFRPEIIIACYTDSDSLTITVFSLLFKEPLAIPILLVLPEAFEALASTLMDRGAADYLLLENLKRLPYAVRNLGEKYRWEMQSYTLSETRH